jgi:hypothetical protein
MNAPSTFPTTTYTRRQARQIAAIAKGEIERLGRANLSATPWVRDGISLARDIHTAALAVLDGESADELQALLAEWAETDPRTFVLVPDLGRKFPFGGGR